MLFLLTSLREEFRVRVHELANSNSLKDLYGGEKKKIMLSSLTEVSVPKPLSPKSLCTCYAVFITIPLPEGFDKLGWVLQHIVASARTFWPEDFREQDHGPICK